MGLQSSAIVVLHLLLAVHAASGSRYKRQAAGGAPCALVPVANKTFVEDIYQFFDKNSGTKILEYSLSFTNYSGNFDFVTRSGKDAFQPHRWFRTQGTGSSQLLLVYHYYYGLFKPYMALGIDSRNVNLTVSPADCLENLTPDQLRDMIRDYLLTDFTINENTVARPFSYSDDVEVCTAHIENQDGWGKLVYRCCGLDSDNRLSCHDVFEGAWTWVLRVFIIAVTIILFLYFPVLIPHGYRIYSYLYYPPDDLTFTLRLTRKRERYRNVKTCQILEPGQWKTMKAFHSEVIKLREEKTYTWHVKKVHLNVYMNRLLAEGGTPINFTRYLFDSFVRCQIRHSDPLEGCCNAPACGEEFCSGCPPWHSWLKAVRTILVLAVLAVPSLPFMYAISAENLDYQQLAQEFEERGLQRSFNFYTGEVFGKVIVAVVGFMYVLHAVIVTADGATDGNISRLYTEVLDIAEKRDTVAKRGSSYNSVIKKALSFIKRFGALFIPVWLVGLCLLPVFLVVLFVFSAPLFRVLLHALKILTRNSKTIERSLNVRRKVLDLLEIFWFCITIIFVFVVLAVGFNFLVHLLAMIIVKVLVDAQLVYRVLPVILLLILYVRDSFGRVTQSYASFQGKIMEVVKMKEAEDLRRECLKSWEDQQNKVFKIVPEPVPFDPDDEIVKKRDKGYITLSLQNKDTSEVDESRPFKIKNWSVRFNLRQLLLFLDKNDFLYLSKKFFFHCCSMDCDGAPGHLEKNFIDAAVDFLKIGVFLLFVFLVVMAYGNAYYISPTNQMFVTLVTGLVPLVLRSVFSSTKAAVAVNTSDYRFEAQLREKIESFSQSWDVEDIFAKKITTGTTAHDVPLKATINAGRTQSSWSLPMPSSNSSEENVDLVLVIPDDSRIERNKTISESKNVPGVKLRSNKIGGFACHLCRGDNSVLHKCDSDPSFSKKDGEIKNNVIDTEASGYENTHLERWIRYNNEYLSNRHSEEVNRAHENHRNEVIGAIDAHLVATLLTTDIASSQPTVGDSSSVNRSFSAGVNTDLTGRVATETASGEMNSDS